MNKPVIDNKVVDVATIEIDGIDTTDYPEFVDAYYSYAEFVDGEELTDDQLDILMDIRPIDYADVVNFSYPI